MRTEEEKEKIYKKAFDTYGADAQMIMLIEELSELTKTCTKYLRTYSLANMGDMAQEMADVEIMIEQIKLIFPALVPASEKWKEFKINRLEKLLNEQEEV